MNQTRDDFNIFSIDLNVSKDTKNPIELIVLVAKKQF